MTPWSEWRSTEPALYRHTTCLFNKHRLASLTSLYRMATRDEDARDGDEFPSALVLAAQREKEHRR